MAIKSRFWSIMTTKHKTFVFKKKKKKKPTDPVFFGHVTVNTTFFFRLKKLSVLLKQYHSLTVKIQGFQNPQKCCNYPIIWVMWFICYTEIHPKDAGRMANDVDPDQTALLKAKKLIERSKVWAGSYTSVQKLKIISVCMWNDQISTVFKVHKFQTYLKWWYEVRCGIGLNHLLKNDAQS